MTKCQSQLGVEQRKIYIDKIEKPLSIAKGLFIQIEISLRRLQLRCWAG